MQTRRDFIHHGISSFGALAWAIAYARPLPASASIQIPHFPPKAKSIIHLYMEGGPSQVDTFDYKPALEKLAGQPLPIKKPATVFNSSNIIMPSPFQFRKAGQSGSWVSELFPNTSEFVDDLTFIHSMHHDVSNHSAACFMSHTGSSIAGRPSVGSWLSFGCGSENSNLPSHVVLDCGQAPSGGAYAWSNGFLESRHGGVKFNKGKTPVEFLEKLDPSASIQNSKLNFIQRINDILAEDSDFSTRQSLMAARHNYQTADSMQKLIPELTDLSKESVGTRKLYGIDNPTTSDFGERCLMARKLVEAGVRSIEIFSPKVKADRWDQHSGLKQGHINNSKAVDKPIAALIHDLKSRGLLDQTIVLWGGEFGRTPTSQGSNGRDHNPFGYTVFLAGGGFKPGHHHGATDEFGYYAESDRVHIHDLHATLLHQFGLDHTSLTFRFGGRDYRLTDVEGSIIHPILT